jgi:hypothetical protein
MSTAVVVRYRGSETSGIDVSPDGRMEFFEGRLEVIVDVIGPFETLAAAGEWAERNDEPDCDYSTHELTRP